MVRTLKIMVLVVGCSLFLLVAGCVSVGGGWAEEEFALRDGFAALLGRAQAQDEALKGRDVAILSMRETIIAGPPTSDAEYRGEYYWRGEGWLLTFAMALARRAQGSDNILSMGDVGALCLSFEGEGKRGALWYYLYPNRKRVVALGQTVVDALQHATDRVRKQSDVKQVAAGVARSEKGFWRSQIEVQELLAAIRSEPGVKEGENETALQRRAREIWGGVVPKDERPSSFAWRGGRFAVEVSCSYYETLRKTRHKIFRERGGYAVDEIVLMVYDKSNCPERTLRILPGKRILTVDGPTLLGEDLRAEPRLRRGDAE